jgi:hypothetical protein
LDRAQIVVDTSKQQAQRSIVHLLLTVVGMTGIAGLFLPFAYGTSPVNAVSDKELWRLALPFFLSVLASAASIRWIISGSFSGRERTISYAVSASMAGVTLSMWFPFKDGPTTLQDWLAMVSPDAILALGVYFLVRNSRRESSRKFNPVMATQIPYVANAALCLIAFFGEWELGAYCVLVAALAFMLQIILATAPRLDLVKS